MDTTGESYLAGVYMMRFKDADSQGNTAFEPIEAKNRDTEKLAAYYRFTTTELDLEASAFRPSASKATQKTSALSTASTTSTTTIC